MIDPLSLAVSTLVLAISAVTAWLTLFRRGTVKMTQPTVIFFGPDTPRSPNEKPLPKIYLRTLLFATSKRGRVVESMHVSLSRNETHQNFIVWVYGEHNRLVRGSGLFVGETGVSANHHFLTPNDGNAFRFTEGHYQIEVYAKLLGDRTPLNVFSQALNIPYDIAVALQEGSTGLYFDWGPDSTRYLLHTEKRSPSPNADDFFGFLDGLAATK